MTFRTALSGPATGGGSAAFTQRGFTMIELLIVISIAAILAMIAIPSFRDMLNTTRLNSALGLVMSDLNLARGEAIKRNARVLVCVRNSLGTDCAGGTNWQAGWVVCIDADGNNACDASTAAVPNPLAVRPALDTVLTLNTTTGAAVIRFNANSTASEQFILSLVGSTTRTVSVAATGNISKL